MVLQVIGDTFHFSLQVLERTEELQLGLGDPLNSEEMVARRTAYMVDKRNAARMLSRNLGESVGFESNYRISRLGHYFGGEV